MEWHLRFENFFKVGMTPPPIGLMYYPPTKVILTKLAEDESATLKTALAQKDTCHSPYNGYVESY